MAAARSLSVETDRLTNLLATLAEWSRPPVLRDACRPSHLQRRAVALTLPYLRLTSTTPRVHNGSRNEKYKLMSS